MTLRARAADDDPHRARHLLIETTQDEFGEFDGKRAADATTAVCKLPGALLARGKAAEAGGTTASASSSVATRHAENSDELLRAHSANIQIASQHEPA